MYEGRKGQEQRGRERPAGTLKGGLKLVDMVIVAHVGSVTLERGSLRHGKKASERGALNCW